MVRVEMREMLEIMCWLEFVNGRTRPKVSCACSCLGPIAMWWNYRPGIGPKLYFASLVDTSSVYHDMTTRRATMVRGFVVLSCWFS